MNELDSRKVELFENTPVPKAVAKLAIPTIAASIVMVIYNLADTFFVGLLNDPVQTSAVTLAAPAILIFNAVTNLFGVGSSSLMSRALGQKDYDTVKRSAAFGFYCTLLCGIVFSLTALLFRPVLLNILGSEASNSESTSQYIFWTVACGAVPAMLNVVLGNLVRAEGRAMHASVGVMSGCILNIILDPLFIMPWGLDMGASGAGCATFISNTVAMAYFLILLKIRKNDTYVSLNIAYAKPTPAISREVFGVGVPASVQNLLNVTGMTILNNITASYGTEAVSAMGIAHKVALVPLYFSMGGGQGVMPLVGYNYASGNRKRMKETIRYSEKIFIISMLVSGLLFYVFAEELIEMFMTNELIVADGAIFLRGFSLAIPFLAMDFLAVAIFQACGRGKISLIFAIARKIVLEIPAILILNRIFGMPGLGYGQLVAETVISIAATVMLEKLVRETGKETPAYGKD